MLIIISIFSVVPHNRNIHRHSVFILDLLSTEMWNTILFFVNYGDINLESQCFGFADICGKFMNRK